MIASDPEVREVIDFDVIPNVLNQNFDADCAYVNVSQWGIAGGRGAPEQLWREKVTYSRLARHVSTALFRFCYSGFLIKAVYTGQLNPVTMRTAIHGNGNYLALNCVLYPTWHSQTPIENYMPKSSTLDAADKKITFADDLKMSSTNPISFFDQVRSTYPTFKSPEISLEEFNLDQLIDFHLIHNSNYPFGILSDEEKIEPSFKDLITWNEIGNGILKVVEQLSQNIKRSSTSTPEIVGIISSDEPLSHFTLLLGIIKSGLIPFVISPLNSPEAIAHLLHHSGCKNVLVQYNPKLSIQNLDEIEKLAKNQMEEVIRILLPDHSINLLECLDTFQLFPRLFKSTSYETNPSIPDQSIKISSSNQPRHVHTPIIYYHTSGTTGFPKLVPINRLGFHALLTSGLHTDFPWSEQLISAMTLPPYHNMGAHVGLDYSLSQGAVSAFYRPELGPNGRSRLRTLDSKSKMRAMRKVGCTVTVFSPLMLTEWSRDSEMVDYLKSNQRVAFGGKPLSKEIGNQLNQKGIKLSNMYGATEVGAIAKLFSKHPLGSNWEYFELSSQIKTQMKQHDENVFELDILSSDQHRCSLTINDDFSPQIYHTRDLLSKHSSLPLYRVVGRLNDQITLNNSVKINPAALEAILTSDPVIKSALLFGEGKPRIGAIIEIDDDQINKNPMNNSQFIELIWPLIQVVNQSIPNPHKIIKKSIIITNSNSNPLPKTLKGTISRPTALEFFSKRIQNVYQHSSSTITSTDNQQVNQTNNLRFVNFKERIEPSCEVSSYNTRFHKT
ncbi:uncharacterized protein MELLADRAFT_117278 [Melampsora larici-populina 98AG31]|uniref:AMP-dependent synthetase/ligase domain-containing protein n=1 Tax=Melampsora larici-populina (strain 98AG31 / pathotype 3-4-7) TaxID=747676 RepID=F4RVC7_MELLP|nr:uncharacterized protein MELLADRAFT_117278 [Melampsora larici-populina 98AG31]EGG03691.1 hypothetical protein MELLADRAFT_117278 [Melampsora larici-populina 98AG31]